MARLLLLLAAGSAMGALSETLVYPAGQSSSAGLPLMAFSPLNIGAGSPGGTIYGSLFLFYVVIGVLNLVGAAGYLRTGAVSALGIMMGLAGLGTAFFWLVFAVSHDIHAGPAFPLMAITLVLDVVVLASGRLRRAWVRPSPKPRTSSALMPGPWG